MKKIGFYIAFVILLIIIIPLIILGGVGNGIKIPGIINKFPDVILEKDIKYDEKTGGPKIKVFVSSEKEIKEMYLEDYIRGVISAEMPVLFDIEALKAQAVAARTYAVGNMKIFGGAG